MKFLLSVLFLFGSLFSLTPGQEKMNDNQLFLFHENNIYPYAQKKYEKAVKDFADMLREANSEGSYRLIQIDRFTYDYIVPVEDYDGLAKYMNTRREVMDKINGQKREKAMREFNGCFASYKDFLMTLRIDLSYKPNYGLNPGDTLNFSHIDYLHIIPGKEGDAEELLLDEKVLYETKNIEEGYRVYIGSIGTDQPVVVFVRPASSRADWVVSSDAQNHELGDEGSKLMSKFMAITKKFEHKDGMMRPDLSYTQKK